MSEEKGIMFYTSPRGYGKTYYELEKLRKENQQLKEELKEIEECEDVVFNNTQFWINKYHEIRQVLDEIRELLNEAFEYGDEWHWDSGAIRNYLEDIEKLLDKVEENG